MFSVLYGEKCMSWWLLQIIVSVFINLLRSIPTFWELGLYIQQTLHIRMTVFVIMFACLHMTWVCSHSVSLWRLYYKVCVSVNTCTLRIPGNFTIKMNITLFLKVFVLPLLIFYLLQQKNWNGLNTGQGSQPVVTVFRVAQTCWKTTFPVTPPRALSDVTSRCLHLLRAGFVRNDAVMFGRTSESR